MPLKRVKSAPLSVLQDARETDHVPSQHPMMDRRVQRVSGSSATSAALPRRTRRTALRQLRFPTTRRGVNAQYEKLSRELQAEAARVTKPKLSTLAMTPSMRAAAKAAAMARANSRRAGKMAEEVVAEARAAGG